MDLWKIYFSNFQYNENNVLIIVEQEQYNLNVIFEMNEVHETTDPASVKLKVSQISNFNVHFLVCEFDKKHLNWSTPSTFYFFTIFISSMGIIPHHDN